MNIKDRLVKMAEWYVEWYSASVELRYQLLVLAIIILAFMMP